MVSPPLHAKDEQRRYALTITRQLDQLRAGVEPAGSSEKVKSSRRESCPRRRRAERCEQIAPRGKPVDVIATELLPELERGERIEVVALGHEQRIGHLLELLLAARHIDREAGVARRQPCLARRRLLVRTSRRTAVRLSPADLRAPAISASTITNPRPLSVWSVDSMRPAPAASGRSVRTEARDGIILSG